MPRRRRRKRKRRSALTMEEILRWAEAWKARTGAWPGQRSGRIPESGGRWSAIEGALRNGLRGLPPGLSLARLLAERRGVQRYSAAGKPLLTIEEILCWADAWKARTGAWPGQRSGRIPESGGRWDAIEGALR